MLENLFLLNCRDLSGYCVFEDMPKITCCNYYNAKLPEVDKKLIGHINIKLVLLLFKNRMQR